MSEESAAEAGGIKETPIDEIVKKCFSWHKEFVRKYWQGKDSFHNAEHIRATLKAADGLVKATLDGSDPLNLMADLAKWNKQHSESQVKKEELAEVVQLAFACHDLGNIAKAVTKKPGGQTDLVFWRCYKAAGAEERSQKIVGKVIEGSEMAEDQKRRFLPLVQHLIIETVFRGKKRAPFGVFVRVTDQIGNDLFNTNDQGVIGLLEEMRAENPYTVFSPAFFFNFARKRFEQLEPAEETRASILKIWNKELPEEKFGLRENLVRVDDWLEKERETAS